MAIVDPDARLDLIAIANGIRIDSSTPDGDADLMGFLIGELCDERDRPVRDRLTNRRMAVLRLYDPARYAELAKRHGWTEE
ncbi:hypothetical protein EON79_21560 [bacterium]|nr:MAG: hypothetical protein EON79_21560 [bacterium]